MNRFLIVSLAALLGLLILVVQFVRARREAALFDSFSLSGWIYFVLFVVIPISLQFLDLTMFQVGPWRWIFRTPFTDDAFVYASLIALIGYPLILAGVRCGEVPLGAIRRQRQGFVHDGRPDSELLIAGGTLLVVGAGALIIYTRSIGGVFPLLLEGILFRLPEQPVISTVAFLKNVAFATLGASYCFYAVKSHLRSSLARLAASGLFWVSFAFSLVVLFHGAGRLVLIAYVATFPLVGMFHRRRWQWKKIVLLGSLTIGVVLFGKQLFLLRNASQSLAARWETVGGDASRAFKEILIEFSWPYLTLANATTDVPSATPYRLFVDVPLAGLYLVPQRVFGTTHPPMVSTINTQLVNETGSGTIPVDLLSFGYFSAGLVGILVVALAFGVLLARAETLFVGLRGTVFRVAVILFVSFRVMYGDPVLVVQTGFHLIMTFSLLLLLQLARRALTPAASRPFITSAPIG